MVIEDGAGKNSCVATELAIMKRTRIIHQGCGRQRGCPEPSFEALGRLLLGGAGPLSFGGFAIICAVVARPRLAGGVRPLCRTPSTPPRGRKPVLRQNRRGPRAPRPSRGLAHRLMC